MFLIIGVVAFIAKSFQMRKPDPLEVICNILGGKKTFMVFTSVNIASDWGIFSHVERNSSLGVSFIFNIKNDEALTSVSSTLAELKAINQGDEFVPIFTSIDHVILENPYLNF